MKKIVLGVTAVAFALVLGVSAVSAQTAVTTVSTTSTAAFTRDLTIGSTGADVTALQAMLIANGKLMIATPTGYFGPLTKTALAAWQASVGITPASGYFGPITRAYIASHSTSTTTTTTVAGCTPGAAFSSTTGRPCVTTSVDVDTDDEDEDEDDDELKGGEASLEDFELSSGDDDDVEEGDSAKIAEIEFDVEDGDVEVNRVDLALVGSGEETDPWDAFESARLIVDGDEVGEVDLSDEDEYLDEDEGTFRFSDLDFIVREGKTANIVVELTAQNGVDGVEDNDADWTLTVEDDGIRATDAEDIEQYISSDSEEVDFSIEEEGEGEELNVSSSNDDIDTETFMVEDDARSEWYDIFAFDIEAEEGDIDLDTVEVTLTTSASTSDMVSDLILEIDGDEFDDWEYVTGAAGSSTRVVAFDIDGDFTIKGDSEVKAVLKAEFKAANGVGYSSSTINTIQARVVEDAVEGEGKDDLKSDGTATGDTHSLAIEGISVDEPTKKSASAETNDGDEATDDEGIFIFEFEVEAFEESAFISLDAARGTTTSPTAGINYVIETSNGVATTTGTVNATVELIENGNEDGGYAEVEDGEPAKFRVTINFNPAHATTTGVSYRARLDSVNFNDAENTAPDRRQVLSPEQDYRTTFVSVQN
jgi:hypothetical protein